MKFKPHDYQEEGIKWLLSKPESGLFWPPGLGKTSVTLAAFHIRRKKNSRLRMLVVAKRRICYRVWPREVDKWGFPFSATVLHNNIKAVHDGADVHVINYESLHKLVPLIRKGKVKYDMLVVDESSQVRNKRTDRWRNLRKILNKFDYRHILTGSPAAKGLMGLFAQCFIMDAGATFGDSIVRFRNQFYYPCGFKGKEYELQEDGEERIYDKLKDRILHVGHDRLKNMPKRKMLYPKVTLDQETMLAYTAMEQDLIVEMREGTVTAANAGVATSKLRQIANGAVYYKTEPEAEDEKVQRKVARLHNEKAEKLLEIVEEAQGTPVLVAVDFHHDRLAINEVLGYDVPFIGGGITDAEANELEEQWNAGKLPVLLGQPDSIAHGLNLQDAGNIVVFYSMTWNYELYEQFYQRVLRQGQKAKFVMVYHIVAEGTVDEVMVGVLRKRGAGQDRLFDALRQHYGVDNVAAKKKVTKKKAAGRKPANDDKPSKPKELPKGFKPKADVAQMLKALHELATAPGFKDVKGKPKCFPIEVFSEGKLTEFSVSNWWMGALQVLGSSSTKHLQEFQKKVLLAKDTIKDDNLGDLYRFSKAALLTVLEAGEGSKGFIEMKNPDALLDWPVKRDMGPESNEEGKQRMATSKKKAAASKKKAPATTNKKTSKKKAGSSKPQGVLCPLGTFELDKLGDDVKVKAGPKEAQEGANAKQQEVLALIGKKTMTVAKLKEAGAKPRPLFACVNKGHLVIV